MKTFAAFVAIAKASDNICPSTYDEVNADSGCYVQSETWAPGVDVSCAMTNEACLTVTCGVGSIDAFFRHDLFQTNNYSADEIMDQIKNGDRELFIGDSDDAMDVNDPDCGVIFESDGIRLNWNYGDCGVTPTMGTNDEGKDVIIYSISVKSKGNSGSDTDTQLEFYVDTSVAASCEYDPIIKINADGFNVNQEDVVAAGGDIGSLASLFSCKFFSDEDRNEELGENSIVNMGSTIYGTAASQNIGGYGLKFKMTRVTFCDESNNPNNCFRVVEGGHGANIVSAAVQKPWFREVGSEIPFRFNSFGFEDNQDQNLMSISCRIRLEVDDGERSLFWDEPPMEGYGETDY